MTSLFVFDNVHGYIRLSEIESEIVDSVTFQRLRRVSQLGLASFVYPGATHSRFSHSLGAMHVMGRVVDNLLVNEPKADFIEKDRQLLRISVLLHDLGHFPFSHVIEGVMKRRSSLAGKHESLSSFLLEKKTEWQISKILEKTGLREDVLKLLEGKYDGPGLYGYLISSDLDVDRLDFLQRDSLHTGVAYGSIDVERILRTMTVDNGANPSFLVALEKGTQAIENYVLGRYHMYNSVYYHKSVTAFELMLDRLYELLSEEKVSLLPTLEKIHEMSEDEFTTYDDNYVSSALAQCMKSGESGVATSLIRMLFSRTPVKEAYRDLAISEERHLKFDELKGDVTTVVRNRLANASGVDRDWIFVREPQIQIVSDVDEEAIYVQKDGTFVKIAEDDRSIVSRLKGLVRRGYRIFTKEEYIPVLKKAIESWRGS